MSKKLIVRILDQAASPLEKELFSQWLKQSAKNQAYFDQAKFAWDKLDDVYAKEKFDLVNAHEKIQLKAEKLIAGSRRLKWRQRAAVAASIVILIGISFFVYNQSIKPAYESFVSENAIREIKLNDGSHVWLNKNSSLQVPEKFLNKERKVYLKGEAFFEVARNEANPFKVFSGKTVIEVLGTSFNISENRLTGDVDLDVNTGKVLFSKVSWKKEPKFLIAGEQAQYSRSENSIAMLEPTDLNFLSWKTGILKFNETPLQQVCSDLSRYYGISVKTTIENKELVLTGNFRNEELSKILTSIELTLDLRIIHQNGSYSIEDQKD